jgi:hypothetical protein
LKVETAEASVFRTFAEAGKPTGKCLLLTKEGVAVIGTLASDATGYVAWAPLPKIPAHIKQRFFRTVQ